MNFEMKYELAGATHSLFTGLFLFLLVFGLPLTWILRDGLGPESVDSSGMDAVIRCLSTYFIGPILAVLAIIVIGTRMILKNRRLSE